MLFDFRGGVASSLEDERDVELLCAPFSSASSLSVLFFGLLLCGSKTSPSLCSSPAPTSTSSPSSERPLATLRSKGALRFRALAAASG